MTTIALPSTLGPKRSRTNHRQRNTLLLSLTLDMRRSQNINGPAATQPKQTPRRHQPQSPRSHNRKHNNRPRPTHNSSKTQKLNQIKLQTHIRPATSHTNHPTQPQRHPRLLKPPDKPADATTQRRDPQHPNLVPTSLQPPPPTPSPTNAPIKTPTTTQAAQPQVCIDKPATPL